MNRADVMSLPAGREIEGLIAVNLFNYQKVPWSGNKEQEVFVQVPEQAETIDWWGKDIMSLVPCYSTDIADAWAVVEQMILLGWQFRLLVLDGASHAWFEKKIQVIQRPQDERPDQLYHAHGETAPLAVCRAAILAVKGIVA